MLRTNGKSEYKVFIVQCIAPALQALSVSMQFLCWKLKICPTMSETSNSANDIGAATLKKQQQSFGLLLFVNM